MKKFLASFFISILIINIFIISFGADNSINELNNSSADNFLNLECGSAVLMEQSTGQVLYSYNAHEKLRPASVTKIMSILLIMEQIDSGKLSYYRSNYVVQKMLVLWVVRKFGLIQKKH